LEPVLAERHGRLRVVRQEENALSRFAGSEEDEKVVAGISGELLKEAVGYKKAW